MSLAADPRLGVTSFGNDQIWELTAGGGEPPALALQTTYGLRARAMRIFPRFIEEELEIVSPAAFHSPPRLRRFYPNFCRVQFNPLEEIDAVFETWVPNSQALCGRLELVNLSTRLRRIRFDLAVVFTPNQGERMSPVEVGGAAALSGQSDELYPVVYMSGDTFAGRGPYPSLSSQLELAPGERSVLTWAQAALNSRQASFESAQCLVLRAWDAEAARIEIVNSGQIEIYTGNPDWDLAFAVSQNKAAGLLVGPTEHLPCPSFVLTRQPDQGFSLRGDGSDYSSIWNGQTPLDTLHLLQYLLPGDATFAQGLLNNFFSTQSDSGAIDWKPGLGAQRSRILATPLLAFLTWQVYTYTQDTVFLRQAYPHLVRFLLTWFSPEHDRDQDGIPEWDNPFQTGFEDHAMFSRWTAWSRGVDISAVESPALCSLLVLECRSLLKIERQLGENQAAQPWEDYAARLETALQASWQPERSGYMYWDRDTHHSPTLEKLAERSGPGIATLQRSFAPAVRLLIHIETSAERTTHPMLVIRGENMLGQHRVERIGEERFRWHLHLGTLTGERVYQSLEDIEIRGISPDDHVTFYQVGYCCPDHTLLLPLWAGIVSNELADEMVNKSVLNPDEYWHRFGIPACPKPPSPESAPVCLGVHMLWNSLIGFGLLHYGYRLQAAVLVERLMEAVVNSLKAEGTFRRLYHADDGQGIGERNSLHGLAPLGAFLQTLGVQVMSPQRVYLQGIHPFPWPVTVKYRGLTILRQKGKTTVIFPDGQTTTVDNPAPSMVALEPIG